MKMNINNMFSKVAMSALVCAMLASCGKSGDAKSEASSEDGNSIPKDVVFLSVKDHNARVGSSLNVEKLGYNAKVKDATDGEFEGNKFLKEIYFTDEFMNVGVGAFKDCQNLEKIQNTGIIQVINDNAFENCVKLTSVKGDVRTFGVDAFKGCTALESVITSDDIYWVREGAFSNCPNLKTVILGMPMSKYDEGGAFEGSPNIEEISIPAAWSKAMFGKLKDLKNLKKVYLLSSEHYAFPASGSEFVAENADLYVPDALLESFKSDDSWGRFKSILPLSQSTYFDEIGWRKQ